MLAGLLWFADTSTGHRLIVDRLAQQRFANGLTVHIGRIDGSIYGRARLVDLRLGDPQGVWLEAREVNVDWRPWAWAANRLDLDELRAPRVVLARLPKFRTTGQGGPLLPGFDIRVGRLQIDRLDVGPAVAGSPRSGSVRGRLDLRSGRALVDLQARLTGGDRLDLKLDAEPDGDRFLLQGALDSPANGVLAALLGTKRPLSIRVGGTGRWAQWTGQATATTGDLDLAQLGLAVRAGRYELDGWLRPNALLAKPVAALGPQVRVKGNAALANRRLDTHLVLGTPALVAGFDGTLDLAGGTFIGSRIDIRLLQPQALVPAMRARDLRLLVALDGPFATARFDWLLTSPLVQFDTTGFEAVRASGQGRLSPWPVNVPVRLSVRRVTGVDAVAGGILANLEVDGLLRVTPKLITGDGLRVRSDKLTSRLTVLLDLATGRYQVALAGQLNRYLIPGLGIVDVRSELRVMPGADGRGVRIAGRAQVWVRRFDNAFLRDLAGGLPYLETDLERLPDGLLRFTNLRIRAPALRLAGQGYRRLDGTFHFEGAGVQARYGPVRLVLDGPIARPRVQLLLQRPQPALGLANVRLNLTPSASGFAWQAAGQSRLGPFTGRGTILLGRETAIQLAELNVSGLRATGTLRVVTGGFDGVITLNGAGVTGTLAFRPQNGVQRMDARLTLRDARFAGPPPIAVRQGQLTAAVLFDPRGLTIDASGSGQGVRYGSFTLARLQASTRLVGGLGQVQASLAGTRARPFDLTTNIQVAADRYVIGATGSVDRRPLEFLTPATIRREGADWRLLPLAVRFAGGTLRLAGRFGRETQLDATVDRLPLSVLDIASPGLGLGGLANGSISYRQGDGPPTGDATLRIRGLSRSGLTLTSRPLDAAVVARLDARALALRAVFGFGGQVIGQAQLQAAPLGGGDGMSRITAAPLFAQIRYSGAADTLWRLAGVEGLDVSGPVVVGADIGGTIDRPQIRGQVQTNALRIESPTSGTVVTGLRATGQFDGSRLVVNQFTGTAGRGTISGRASFSLASAEGFALDIQGQAANADLIRRDDIAATVTGPLRVRASGGRGVISGNLVLDRSAYRLGQASAGAGIPQLKVRELNRPADDDAPDTPPTVWTLAIKARAPNRLAVTGLGLDSEWRADLDIGGEIAAPAISGRAEVVRGGYEFAGKRFDLQRGVLRFGGGAPPDPALDIVASATVNSVNATITVSGTGQRPVITFASVPALPQEELLSRILFGTSITNLSAPEAVQLASAVASLRGGTGLDPINALRRAVGLDRLRIVPADASIGQRTAIAAGKYITRRAYIELISDGAGYTATRAEFQVTRWLSILSTISSIGRQNVSVRVSRDY